MSWVRIEDNFCYNPKTIKAGPEAALLFIGGLCYANRNLTDGFILKEVLPCIAPLPNPEELAKRLVDCGLWELRAGGWQIHDYLDYNSSAQEVRAKREQVTKRRSQTAERMRKLRLRQKEMPTNDNDAPRDVDSDASHNASQPRNLIRDVDNDAPRDVDSDASPVKLEAWSDASHERHASVTQSSATVRVRAHSHPIPDPDIYPENNPLMSPFGASDMDDRGKEEKKINKPDNKTPLAPQENQSPREGGLTARSFGTQNPSLPPRALDLYKILDRFRKAAGTRLALAELIPASAPPPGFSGMLPPALERQWYDFLQEYSKPLGLSQAELEERFAWVGKYFALGKNYWVKDGQIVSLRWFCSPMQRERAYQLIDEAVTWSQTCSQKSQSAPQEKPKPLPQEITPEERQEAQEIVSQAPESIKEMLSRLTGTVFQRQAVSIPGNYQINRERLDQMVFIA